jgi:hypothetical protein
MAHTLTTPLRTRHVFQLTTMMTSFFNLHSDPYMHPNTFKAPKLHCLQMKRALLLLNCDLQPLHTPVKPPACQVLSTKQLNAQPDHIDNVPAFTQSSVHWHKTQVNPTRR